MHKYIQNRTDDKSILAWLRKSFWNPFNWSVIVVVCHWCDRRDQSCTKRNSKFHRWEIHFGRFRRNTIESSWHSALIKGECVRQDKTVRETKTKQPIRFCDLTRSWDTNRNWFSSRNVREISSSKKGTTRLGQLYLEVFAFSDDHGSFIFYISSTTTPRSAYSLYLLASMCWALAVE